MENEEADSKSTKFEGRPLISSTNNRWANIDDHNKADEDENTSFISAEAAKYDETISVKEYFEPPFTAPLAPFNNEFMAQVGSNNSEKHKHRQNHNNTQILDFIKQETGNADAEASVRNTSTTSTLQMPEDADFYNEHDNKSKSISLAPMNVNDDDCSCPGEFYQRSNLNPSLFFDDQKRSIDYVLVYKRHQDEEIEKENISKRTVFEENLLQQGLELEKALKSDELNFVKLHAPLEVLRRYSEILKLRMPMKESLCQIKKPENPKKLIDAAEFFSKKIPGIAVVNRSTNRVFSGLKGIASFFARKFFVDQENFPKSPPRFTAIYSRNREYLFDIRHHSFFTTAVRSRIVQFILDRQRFTDKMENDMAFGIDRLITENIYIASYPLHDGEIYEKGTMREKLYSNWASLSNWYRYQPVDYIKEYFGVKIGLYFAWLGFYTFMLLLASVVGLACFLYSILTLQYDIPVQEICYPKPNQTIIMCPLCDWCTFWNLKETCFYAKVTYLIDNPSTIFFAVFMSFWATLFLELWKRYSAEITHRWDLTGFDVHEEHPRPQYLARLQHLPSTRTDYVTNLKEPTVPFWRMKFPAAVFSFSMVILLIALAVVGVLAVVVYRMSLLAAINVGSSPNTTAKAIVLATASAACINLCLLYVLNYVYNYLAVYLTEREMWRTQTQFDDALTLKIYLLQFVNYYASIFYIAFVKGKFIGHPGGYQKWFDYRQEECSAGGCLTELCIQLAIIMIGKQAVNSILEVTMPMFWRKILSMQVGLSRLFSRKDVHAEKKNDERWYCDLKLLEWGTRSLFPEYLEMVLQYGFLTIFVTAFPLAPFFALLNNILEMRLDAKKLLTHHRRPVSQRVRDIGVWYRILNCIGKLSVITNAFIIAFTSEFIPRLVYRGSNLTTDHSLTGYLNFKLSDFRISDSKNNQMYNLTGTSENLTICKYTDYREPPDAINKYELTSMFYIILACRLAFVVVFENFVALVMIIVRWCIPGMSVELRDQIRRETYITNELIIEQEAERARHERDERSNSKLYQPENNVQCNANEKFLKFEKLLANSVITQSDMDLIIHGENSTTGISGAA